MKHKLPLGLIVGLAIGLRLHALPVVTNCVTTPYASVIDPMKLSFGTNGVLYVGRDNSGSGGGVFDAVKIHRIGPGGSPVEEFGNVAVADPDAVAYDALGLVSGMPGSVLGGGATGASALISKIAPDGTVSALFGGPLTNIANAFHLHFDSAGRLHISDSEQNRVVMTASSAPPTSLCVATGANAMAFDANHRLAVASDALPRLQLFAANGTLLNANFATVRLGAPVVAGPGDAFWGTDLYSVNTNAELIRITPAGNVTVVGSGFGDESAAGISDLAFGPDNALYYSHRSEDRVLRIAPNTVPFPPPTHWWPGEGNAQDVIGGAHGILAPSDGYTLGTTTPAANYPASVVGQGFRFSTNGSALNCGTAAGAVGTNDFTLSFWFNSTNTATRGLFGKIPSTCGFATGWFVEVYNSGAIRFFIGESTVTASIYSSNTNKVCDGQWHHVAVVRSNLYPAIYVDGHRTFGGATGGGWTYTPSLVNLTNDAQFVLGGSVPPGGCMFWPALNGGDRYDEIQFYGAALDEDQIYLLSTLQVNTGAPVRPTLQITPGTPGFVTISWTPDTPGFGLQETLSLSPTNWVNSASGSTNPAAVPAAQPTKFYRLFKP